MSDHFVLGMHKITIEDAGALPFTIAARFELAFKRLYPDLECEYSARF